MDDFQIRENSPFDFFICYWRIRVMECKFLIIEHRKKDENEKFVHSIAFILHLFKVHFASVLLSKQKLL